MVNTRHYPKVASLLLLLFAQTASADLLFTNFDGNPFGGALYTAGGPCQFASCFAIGDNFSTDEPWHVTGFTFYVVSQLSNIGVGTGVRFAVYTAAGALVAGPADGAPTVTDTGLVFGTRTIYKVEITSLNIDLAPGEYQFRSANASNNGQGVFPGYGTPSAQSISPGFFQLTGSQSVEAVLSTVVTQRNENWAFQVIGTRSTVFANGFEAP